MLSDFSLNSAQENVNLKHRDSVPTTEIIIFVADPRQSADSAQVRMATIALHTEQENTRNLQEAYVFQRRRTRSFLVG